MDAASHPAGEKADGAVAHAQADFPQPSVPANQRGDCANQPDSAWLGAVLCRRPFEPVLLVHSRLGREEDSAPFGAGQPASRFRLEAVDQGMALWDARPLRGVPRCPLTVARPPPPTRTAPYPLPRSGAGARSAANPHAACEAAGTGNGITATPTRARRGKPWTQPRSGLRITAPVPDPTACVLGAQTALINWRGRTRSSTRTVACRYRFAASSAIGSKYFGRITRVRAEAART